LARGAVSEPAVVMVRAAAAATMNFFKKSPWVVACCSRTVAAYPDWPGF
jgi:hypothetical protein